MSKADGEIMWGEFMNSLDEQRRADFLPINIPLPGAALIDDVESMAKLRASVRSCATGSTDRLEVAKALVASCFFFELNALPVSTSAGYLVRGSIKCRLDSHVVIEAMTSLDMEHANVCTDLETLTSAACLRGRICFLCRTYREDVSFYVQHLAEPVTIYFQADKGSKRKLSGFPQSIDWFIAQQGLDKVFGTPDHGSPALLHCYACSGVSRRSKRGKAHNGLHSSRKKIRLTQTILATDVILDYIQEVKEEQTAVT
jgi:hypothetical protein